MARIFNYVVLMAIPDRARGERVNVGIITFLPDKVDVRLAEIGKLHALTGASWDNYADDMRLRLLSRFVASENPKAELEANPRIDPYFQVSSVAWFSLNSNEEYEPTVKGLLASLVMKPKTPDERQKTTRINTEIVRALKNSHVLAKPGEAMEENRVHRNFFVEDDLRADFAQRNGVLRVATTLDLRRPRVDLREAALKALTLDRAKIQFGKKIERICVYATAFPDDKDVRSAVGFVEKYASQTFNWADLDGRKRFMNFIFQGASHPGPLV